MKKIVFIPGLLGDATLWQDTIDILAKDYICEVFSIQHGHSLETLAQSLWQTIKDEVVLVGFSLGAWIALQAYGLFPQRCQGLILISSAPGHLKPATLQRFHFFTQQITSGGFEAFIQADFEHDVAKGNHQNPQLKNKMIAMMQRQGPQVAINQLNMMTQFKGDFSDLSYIHCPSLLIRGEQDKSINIERQVAISKEIGQCHMHTIPNAAHYIPFENPKLLAQIIKDWLKESVK